MWDRLITVYLKTHISSHPHARIRIRLLLFLRVLVVLRIFVQFFKQTFEFGLVFGHGPLYSVMNIYTVAQSLFQCVQNVSVNVVKLQSFVLPQVSLLIIEKLRFDFGRRLPAGLFFGISLLHALHQVLFQSFAHRQSTGLSSLVQPLFERFVLLQAFGSSGFLVAAISSCHAPPILIHVNIV